MYMQLRFTIEYRKLPDIFASQLYYSAQEMIKSHSVLLTSNIFLLLNIPIHTED